MLDASVCYSKCAGVTEFDSPFHDPGEGEAMTLDRLRPSTSPCRRLCGLVLFPKGDMGESCELIVDSRDSALRNGGISPPTFFAALSSAQMDSRGLANCQTNRSGASIPSELPMAAYWLIELSCESDSPSALDHREAVLNTCNRCGGPQDAPRSCCPVKSCPKPAGSGPSRRLRT